MNRSKPAVATLLLLYLLLAAMLTATYARLPHRVATHFNLSGQPDGWSLRPSFAAFSLVFAAAMGIIIAGSLYLVRYFPDSAINIPNKEHWMAEGRRRQTYDTLFSLGLGLASLTMALLIGMEALIIRANLADPVRLPSTGSLALMGAYLAGTVALIWLAYRRLRRVD